MENSRTRLNSLAQMTKLRHSLSLTKKVKRNSRVMALSTAGTSPGLTEWLIRNDRPCTSIAFACYRAIDSPPNPGPFCAGCAVSDLRRALGFDRNATDQEHSIGSPFSARALFLFNQNIDLWRAVAFAGRHRVCIGGAVIQGGCDHLYFYNKRRHFTWFS